MTTGSISDTESRNVSPQAQIRHSHRASPYYTVPETLRLLAARASHTRNDHWRRLNCDSQQDWTLIIGIPSEPFGHPSLGYPPPTILRRAYLLLTRAGSRAEIDLALGGPSEAYELAIRSISVSTPIPQSLWGRISPLLTTCTAVIRDDTERRLALDHVAVPHARYRDARFPGTRWSYVGSVDSPCASTHCPGHWQSTRNQGNNTRP